MNKFDRPPEGKPETGSPRDQPRLPHRILVADDDADIRRVNTEMLNRSGYQVDAVKDGAEAWDALQLADYDLLVTDNQMPRVTGVELIQKLQAAGMALPVIMVTGAPPDESFDPYRSLHPTLTLLKPHTFDDLLEAVKAVLCPGNQGQEETAMLSDSRHQPATNGLRAG